MIIVYLGRSHFRFSALYEHGSSSRNRSLVSGVEMEGMQFDSGCMGGSQHSQVQL